VKREAWSRARGLFEAALQVPRGERARFVAERCGDDDDLRTLIEGLLSAEERSGGFLEGCAAVDLWGPDAELEARAPGGRPRQRIGDYLIERRIGHGGVGAVYLARPASGDGSAPVALKVIRREMASGFVVVRFLQEQQILARLDHPNIARLLDCGTTDDGLPFIVMEHVDGEPIHDYCRRRDIPLPDRLTLFRRVGEAVSYAHRHLVVHRDITPHNILVTDDGEPKLLDFGLATLIGPPQAADGGKRTATVLRMLTPAYASPEQVRGAAITTASDVYSLGVVLYELLTGERPYRFQSHAPDEIARVVCEEPPARTGAFAALPSDLRNILLVALRKEPHRRYPSVDAFGEDVRRYLVGLPVSARRDTFAYRAGKFLRRHRIGVSAAAVLSLAVAGGVTSTVWQARVAEFERLRAERRYRELRRLAGGLLFELDEAIMDLAGSTAARELLVTRALQYLSALEADSVGDLSLQRELAVAFSRVGEVQSRGYGLHVGDLSGALGSFHKAMVIRQGLVDANPEDLQDQDDLAESLLRIAQVMGAMCDPADDVQYARQAVTIRTVLVEADADNRHFRDGLAEAYATLGMALMRAGDRSGTAQAFAELRRLREELLAADTANPRARCDLAEAILATAEAQAQSGDAVTALANLRQAEAINEGLVVAYPASERYRRELLRARTHMGAALRSLGRSDEAIQHVSQAVAIGERLQATDRSSAEARHGLAEAYRELGATQIETGSRGDALATLEQARALLESWWSANPANVQIAVTLAGVYEGLGSASEPSATEGGGLSWLAARVWYQQSLDLWHELAIRDRLAPLYQVRADRVAEALVRCEEAIVRLPATVSSDDG